MKKYIIRLDDAAEKMNIDNWEKMENILDRYDIKPLVGVIPAIKDEDMNKYEFDESFWNKVKCWEKKGWIIALHGYEHVFETTSGGINPVNNKSEFAGVNLEKQKKKISAGIEIFNENNIYPKVFFAPAHTFDENTLQALKDCSDIRIISDTIANDSYYYNGFTFVPQQSGKVRNLPFKINTFCYHPNTMSDNDFKLLERFIIDYRKYFVDFPTNTVNRKRNLIDNLLKIIYFGKRKLK